MAFLSVIRRWHLREGMPIREIERRTGLSRKAIRDLCAGTRVNATKTGALSYCLCAGTREAAAGVLLRPS